MTLFPICPQHCRAGAGREPGDLSAAQACVEIESVGQRDRRCSTGRRRRNGGYKSARLTGPDGETVVDFADSNLHVVSYSEPVRETLSLGIGLQSHLHSLPDQPDLVPYVTSYYRRNWVFCLPHRVRDGAAARRLFSVEVDSEFVPGGVPFAWCDLPGESDRLVQLSSYLCHPSLANNELSGPLGSARPPPAHRRLGAEKAQLSFPAESGDHRQPVLPAPPPRGSGGTAWSADWC